MNGDVDWAGMYRQALEDIKRLTNALSIRRRLFDGVEPRVGQRVVTVLETATKWGMPHAHDNVVHEITSLLGGDTHLVECGPQQIGVAMLRLAPEGAEVTCKSCLGWREQMAKMRIDSEVFRREQFGSERMKAALEKLRGLAISDTDMPPAWRKVIVSVASEALVSR